MKRKIIIFLIVLIVAGATLCILPERIELARRRSICEEYRLSADPEDGFEVRFALIWEALVYGRDDYEIRDLTPDNACDDAFNALSSLLSSLQYSAEYNRSTEVLDGLDGEYPMRITVTCRNGGHIELRFSGSGTCTLAAIDKDENILAASVYTADPESCDRLRACGGLPPIPDIDTIIEAGKERREQEQNAEPKVITPTWQNKQ